MKQNTRKIKKDWHPADIICALRKAGWSVRKLSLHFGYASPNTLCNAINRPWPKGERLIADAIGVPAEEIWPERFAERLDRQSTISRRACHVKKRLAG